MQTDALSAAGAAPDAGHGSEWLWHLFCLASCPHTGAACFHPIAISTVVNAVCPALIQKNKRVTLCQEL